MRRPALAAPAIVAALTVTLVLASSAVSPPPARAGVVSVLCGVAGDVTALAGTACDLGSKAISIGGKLFGSGGTAARVAGLAATAVAVWVGARAALRLAAGTISHLTRPRLQSTWFSASYWRVAAVAALLTLPFLFAAAVQSLLRGDLSLLARAALGHLPLAMLAVAIAAPLCMLALAATDEMSALVGSAGLGGGARFLGEIDHAGALTAVAGAPFLAIAIGLLMIAGALALGLELIVREAAVYVVVLMLPLAFAAMVWPARRAIAARMVELLVALILSKFVIVSVLGLAGAALGHLGHGRLQTLFGALALLALAVGSPIMLMRLIPLSELAAGTGGRATLLAAGDRAAPARAIAGGAGVLAPLGALDDPGHTGALVRPPLPPTGSEDRISDGSPGADPASAAVGPASAAVGPASATDAAVAAPAAQRSADGQRALAPEPWWTDPDAMSGQELCLDQPAPGAMFSGPAAAAAAAALGRRPPEAAADAPPAPAPPAPAPPAPAPSAAGTPPAPAPALADPPPTAAPSAAEPPPAGYSAPVGGPPAGATGGDPPWQEQR